MNKLVQFIQYMENRENDQDQLLKADTLLKEMEKVGNQQQLRKERGKHGVEQKAVTDFAILSEKHPEAASNLITTCIEVIRSYRLNPKTWNVFKNKVDVGDLNTTRTDDQKGILGVICLYDLVNGGRGYLSGIPETVKKMGLSRDVLPESDSSQETQQYGSNVLRGTDTDAKESNQHTTDLNIQQIAQDQSFTGGGSSISAYDDSKGTTPIIDRNPGTKVEKIDIPVLPNFGVFSLLGMDKKQYEQLMYAATHAGNAYQVQVSKDVNNPLYETRYSGARELRKIHKQFANIEFGQNKKGNKHLQTAMSELFSAHPRNYQGKQVSLREMIQETNHPDRSKFYQLVLKYTQAPQQSSVPEIQALGKFTEEALGDSEAVFRRKISSNY